MGSRNWAFGLIFGVVACAEPGIAGDWDVDRFELEIEDTDWEARSVDGTLEVAEDLDCEFDVTFEDITDDKSTIDLEGDVDDEGNGDFTLNLEGDVDIQYYGKAFDLAGPVDCVLEEDVLDCEGDLDLADKLRVTMKMELDRKL
ncbi:MAG: hypothetical protein KTR31_22345 [Myxococcales bacterium]|nr:hypothetical protein [Myxococcales bacterium]